MNKTQNKLKNDRIFKNKLEDGSNCYLAVYQLIVWYQID